MMYRFILSRIIAFEIRDWIHLVDFRHFFKGEIICDFLFVLKHTENRIDDVNKVNVKIAKITEHSPTMTPRGRLKHMIDSTQSTY